MTIAQQLLTANERLSQLETDYKRVLKELNLTKVALEVAKRRIDELENPPAEKRPRKTKTSEEVDDS